MKLGITTFGCDGGKSGLSQYTIQLLKEFAIMPSPPQIEVLVYQNEQDIFIPAASSMIPHCFPESLKPAIRNLMWHQTQLPKLCRKQKYNALFLPAANRRIPFFSPCPTIGTVHDFASLHIKSKYDSARMLYVNKVLPALIRRLTKVITISESSKKDIVQHVGISADKITVIPEAVNHQTFFPLNKEEAQRRILPKYSIRPPYILFTSRIEHPGKNHFRLIQAYNQLREKEDLPHQLVLVGNDWGRAIQVHQEAKKSKFARDIIFTGFVPNSELPDFYRGADIFVFPSLFEGFGLPILEAMACGIPVACSNTSSLPEVAGDSASFFDPYQIDEITFKMKQLLTDSQKYAYHQTKGLEHSKKFHWVQTAKQTLDTIYSVI